jgi:vancomycin resistance protein VanJ
MSVVIKSIRLLISVAALIYSVALVCLILLRWGGRDHRWWVAFLINFLPLYFLPVALIILIGWMLRARLAFYSSIPLMILGIILYGPWFLPKPSAPTGGSFRVITFNVSEDNANPETAINWLREQHAQLVLLQEVDVHWFSRLQTELSSAYPFQFSVLTEVGERGNLVLSQYPVISILPQSEDAHVFQRFVVNIEGKATTIYNTSLWAPVADSEETDLSYKRRLWELALSYDDRARNMQIAHLLRETSIVANPYLVAGDFNMSDASSIYASLAAQMVDSFRQGGVGLGNTWPVVRCDGLGRLVPTLLRLDYVWHSHHFQTLSAELGPLLGSDHLPVIVTLRFRDE